jgi:hypothetical protein
VPQLSREKHFHVCEERSLACAVVGAQLANKTGKDETSNRRSRTPARNDTNTNTNTNTHRTKHGDELRTIPV